MVDRIQKIGGYMIQKNEGLYARYYCKELYGLSKDIPVILQDKSLNSSERLIRILRILNPVTLKVKKIQRVIRRSKLCEEDYDRCLLEKICFILDIFKMSTHGINRSTLRNPPNENNVFLGFLFPGWYGIEPVKESHCSKVNSEITSKELEHCEELFWTLVRLINDVGED